MARKIQHLPDRLINQIAAGEVVERPFSVVRELVENSIDAGATRVHVTLRNGGKSEIRVADDGCGMGREDALLSLDRHATSKLRDAEGLNTVRTLGFRGEALPSIASVGRLVIETAEREGDGTRLAVTAGQLHGVEGCARRVGTTVAVRTLFFNVPARAKFLRSAAAETRAVTETLTTLALAHPRVGFHLESNGSVLLDLAAVADYRDRVAGLWGEPVADTLIRLAFRTEQVALSGWVQRPDAATPGNRRAYLFVDGRGFVDRSLVRAAYRAYQTTVPAGARPLVLLFFDVPAGGVDVNVHPAKSEVRFRNAAAVERAVEEGVRTTLGTLPSAPGLGRGRAAPSVAVPAEPDAPPGRQEPESVAATGSRPPHVGEAAEPQMTLFVPSGSEAGMQAAADGSSDAPRLASAPAMWQLHNTYILAETRQGLIIVDQHSAHERVLFEQWMRGLATEQPNSQRLLFPLTLHLSPVELTTARDLLGLLSQTGFEVELFGSRSIIVHAVPAPHPYFDAERCLREMIAELAGGSSLVDPARTQHQRVGLSFACKAAIKAGQRLSADEMRELFDRLFATELPYHDIHGRPTIVQLPLTELHNRFGRHT